VPTPISSFGKAYGSRSQLPPRYRARGSAQIWPETNEGLDELRLSLYRAESFLRFETL
jgi:hypothetical protein